MAPRPPSPSLRASLEATLRFAWASGAWIVPGVSGSEVPPEESAAARALESVRAELGDCRRCDLWRGRTKLVFGVGSPEARLMFVGEAPGAEEDRRGEPFVGRAGQLLDRMIGALGLGREQVYIANVLKSRPPGNRDPRPEEVAACLPFLWRQIEAIRPRVICALGGHAARNLLGTDAPVGSLRGRPQSVRGWTVVPNYHPAYLLRNPSAKARAWQDLRAVSRLLNEPPS